MTWSCDLRTAVEHEFRAAQRMARGVVERVGDDRPPVGPRPTARRRTARIVQLRDGQHDGQPHDGQLRPMKKEGP